MAWVHVCLLQKPDPGAGGVRGTDIWLCFAPAQGESKAMGPRNAEAHRVLQSRYSQRYPTSAGLGTGTGYSMLSLG